MKYPIIGIDFGSTNSVISAFDERTGTTEVLANENGSLVTPSMVYFESMDTILVGEIAQNAQLYQPQHVVDFVKRHLGTDYQFTYQHMKFSATEIAGMIFRKLKNITELALGDQVKDVVITCPVYFGALQRDSLARAASIAGFNPLALLNEPTSAALAFGATYDGKTRHYIVFHLGGDTFDVSILRVIDNSTIEVIASDGRADLGGRYFDDAIVKFAIESFREKTNSGLAENLNTLALLRHKAEEAKRRLSTNLSTSITLRIDKEVLGLVISRAQFVAAIQSDIELMRATIVNMLAESTLTTDDIQDVFLTGGSTFIPAVREMVEGVFGRAANIQIHPIEAAARGAAVYAGKLFASQANSVASVAKYLPSIHDVLSHSIGITAQQASGKPINYVVLARGVALPASAELKMAASSDQQTSFRISINEGEGDELAYVRHIADIEHEFRSPKPKGYPITIKLVLDASGILKVMVLDADGQQEFQYAIGDEISIETQLSEAKAWLSRQEFDGDSAVPTTPPESGAVPSLKSPLASVQFSLYHPKRVEVNSHSGLFVYAHVQQALLEIIEDVQKFKAELGGEINHPKVAKNTAELSDGTKLTVVPESDEIEFEPTSLTKKWRGDWTRFAFEFRPSADLENETVFVRVSIQVANVEIAHIKCAVDVAKGKLTVSNTDSNVVNPLASAKLTSKSTTPYQSIFISYSRKDLEVARAYKAAQIALGNDVFLDVDNLRAGQDWKAQLAKAIDSADILQLFWSENSSASEYCRYEWDYALNYRCSDTKCVDFIRPVYWRTPLPPPPEPLSHLNFRFALLEQKKD